MATLLFKFTEYATLNQIYVVAPSEQDAKAAAKTRGDYRTMQWLGDDSAACHEAHKRLRAALNALKGEGDAH